MATLREIEAAIDRYIDRAPDRFHDAKAEIIAATYQEAIDTSPVRTGAYRASHMIRQGELAGSSPTVYESPSRPDPDNPPRASSGAVLAAPNSADALAALREVREYGITWIVNPVRHAPYVEYLHGYLVYANAGVLARQLIAARAARERRT